MKTTIGNIDVGSETVRRALLFSIGDAACWQIMFVLVENFAVAAALSLKAPALAISLLGSLPMFIGSFAQVIALRMVNPAKPRKEYVVFGTRLQILCIMAASFAGFLPRPASFMVLIAAYSLYVISARLFETFWQTWFSDLVPAGVMGRHVAWRNTILASLGLCVSVGVGLIARSYSNDNSPWIFFFFIFTIAAIARLGSSTLLCFQYEPPKQVPLRRFSFKSIRLPRSLIMFAVGMALFNGAATLSGPFFGVWVLRDLKFNYLNFSIMTACATLGGLLAVRFWGALADRIGAARVLIICTFGAAIVPLPFLILHEIWQIWIFNLYSGIVWVGLGNSSFKYLLQSLDKEQPEQTLTIVNCIQGTVVFIFGLLGGVLATRLPHIFGWQLQTLFLLSSVLRVIIWGVFIIRIHDVNKPFRFRTILSRSSC